MAGIERSVVCPAKKVFALGARWVLILRALQYSKMAAATKTAVRFQGERNEPKHTRQEDFAATG